MSRAKIKRHIETLHPSVKKELEIVTPKDLGQDQLFHISTDPAIKTFEPFVSRRTANKEDRKTPRVSTAMNISGAILAYQAIDHDFEEMRDKQGFRGGWYIYAFDFDFAAKPNNKVVYDAEATDEIWLLPYHEELWKIPARKVGKFFLESLTKRWVGQRETNTLTIVLENSSDVPVHLHRKWQVGKGFYKFELENLTPGHKLEDIRLNNFTELNRSEYKNYKKVNASMLSYQTPPSAHW